MTDIYKLHDAAFAHVSAFVVLKDGERVATVAFKRGNSVQCFAHLIGLEMTRGRANGGGYDRNSASFYDAVSRIKHPLRERVLEGEKNSIQLVDKRAKELWDLLQNFTKAAHKGNGGSHWDAALREAGFTVLQAV